MSKKNKYGLSSRDYAKLYDVWRHFCERCYKPGTKEYEAYGGRGITVCDEWKDDFHTFADWAVANGWKPGLTIERIDVHRGYEPLNCSFIPRCEQVYNLQSSIMIEIDGEKKSLPEWCNIFGVRRGMVVNRINRGETEPTRLFFNGNLKDYGRRIVQYDLDGNEIQAYGSSGEASRATGVRYEYITNCCDGKWKTAGGYAWKYKSIKEKLLWHRS